LVGLAVETQSPGDSHTGFAVGRKFNPLVVFCVSFFSHCVAVLVALLSFAHAVAHNNAADRHLQAAETESSRGFCDNTGPCLAHTNGLGLLAALAVHWRTARARDVLAAMACVYMQVRKKKRRWSRDVYTEQ